MRISGATRILSALTFSLAAAVVWEFCEYAMDTFFKLLICSATQLYTVLNPIWWVSRRWLWIRLITLPRLPLTAVPLGVDGYLDLGHIDTMNDMLSNTVGGGSVQRAGVDFFPEAKWAVFTDIYAEAYRE